MENQAIEPVLGRTLPLTFFLVDIFQVSVSSAHCFSKPPKTSSLFSKYSPNDALKYGIVFTVGEPLLLLKELRPRPIPPPLFPPLYAPLPKKCCSEAAAITANQGKGQKSSSANAQHGREAVNALRSCSHAFAFVLSPSKRWDGAVVFPRLSLNVTLGTSPAYMP